MVLSSRALEKNIGKARGLQNGRFLASFYNHLKALGNFLKVLILPYPLFTRGRLSREKSKLTIHE